MSRQSREKPSIEEVLLAVGLADLQLCPCSIRLVITIIEAFVGRPPQPSGVAQGPLWISTAYEARLLMAVPISPILPSILAATDFSAAADRAVDRAFLLGRSLGRQTIVQHVVEAEAGLLIGRRRNGNSLHSRLGAARKQMDFEIAGHEGCFGQLSVGSVADEIKRACRAGRCELIVLGQREVTLLATGLGDLLLQRIAVPVLLVRRRARYAYQSLIVPTDFSPASQRCVEIASSISPTRGCRFYTPSVPHAGIGSSRNPQAPTASWTGRKRFCDLSTFRTFLR